MGEAKPRGSAGSGGVLRPARLSLAGQFLIASLVILVVGMLALGAWVGQQIENSVLQRTSAITALYVQSVIEPYLQSLAHQPRLSEAEVAALDGLLVNTPLGERVVAFKIWSPDGKILYSPNRLLIGRRFDTEMDLARSLNGEVTAELSDLSGPENEFERQRWDRLLEVYVPVRERAGARITAVVEFYQLPDDLERDIAAARLRSWVVVAAGTLLVYALLAGIVKRGSDTITRQQAALRQKVAELSQLLEQNARLHERVRQAAGRTTALNEQALRRISADLHDGPGQALALALLRLDSQVERAASDSAAGAAQDIAVVQEAVRDALDEIRTISAGLRQPNLIPMTVAEVAERAVREHERRGGAVVETSFENLPAQVSLPVKIALFRSLQEALSNATRHGGGLGVSARVWSEPGQLCLAVSDRGLGFVPNAVGTGERLGLAGMRERAELLGGSFQVESAPGRGTTVRVCWPVIESEDR